MKIDARCAEMPLCCARCIIWFTECIPINMSVLRSPWSKVMGSFSWFQVYACLQKAAASSSLNCHTLPVVMLWNLLNCWLSN